MRRSSSRFAQQLSAALSDSEELAAPDAAEAEEEEEAEGAGATEETKLSETPRKAKPKGARHKRDRALEATDDVSVPLASAAAMVPPHSRPSACCG